MARKIDELLAEYGESHQDPTNKRVHWICVPAIAWSLMALIYALPSPAFFQAVGQLNWLTVVLALALIYYIALSPRLALGFLLFALGCIWLIGFYQANFTMPLWQFALIVFVIAWIGQFWGHKVEGKKPSFFKDVQFLLIGPAWLLSFIYKRIGLGY